MKNKKKLIIHWTRLHSGSFDSMRASFNLEKLLAPATLYMDIENPFLCRGFFVLLSALSAKKIEEIWMKIDFNFLKTDHGEKYLYRTQSCLKDKNISLILEINQSDESLKHKEIKKKLIQDGFNISDGHYLEKNVFVFKTANLEEDEFSQFPQEIAPFFTRELNA